MELIPGTVRVTADGTIGVVGQPLRIYSAQSLSGGGGASVVAFRNGGTVSGDVWLQLNAATSVTGNLDFSHGVRFPNGCFVDLDANTTSVTITFATEA